MFSECVNSMWHTDASYLCATKNYSYCLILSYTIKVKRIQDLENSKYLTHSYYRIFSIDWKIFLHRWWPGLFDSHCLETHCQERKFYIYRMSW